MTSRNRRRAIATSGSEVRTSDRRTAFASALFFTVALLNPRDFPVENVPLIYPAFLVFWIQMGRRAMLQGLIRVKYLMVLLIGYQSYFTVLRLVLGTAPSLGEFAYLIEPVMILMAAGAATVRPGGTKATIWVLVSVVTFSTACGIGIYTVGEPFISLRSTIQYSVGGTVASGTILREMDLETELAAQFSVNSGLSSDIVSFAYQLSAAIVLVVTAMLAKRRSTGVSYNFLVFAFMVLLAGIITNTQRATVLAALVGAAAFMFSAPIKGIVSVRSLSFLVVGAVSLLGLVIASERWSDKASLLTRSLMVEGSNLNTAVRLYMPIPAVESIIYQPFGAGGLSDHYKQAAFALGWVTSSNGFPEAHSPHNHFANIIMFGGVAGLLATFLLFRGLWRRILSLRDGQGGVYARMLAAACVASVFHSFFHNAGFFGLVPPTLIVFGMLWGEMPHGRPRFATSITS